MEMQISLPAKLLVAKPESEAVRSSKSVVTKRKCSYQELCRRFVASLAIPGDKLTI